MKSINFFLLLFLFPLIGMAQYQPMLEVGNEWYVHQVSEFGYNSIRKFYITKDTFLNGYIHYEVVERECDLDGRCTFIEDFAPLYYREDTLLKRVYVNNGNIAYPEKESLLYDFSLQVRDTFITATGAIYVLDSIAYNLESPFVCNDGGIQYDAGNRKVFYFSVGLFSSIVWVEGIGSMTGLQETTLDWSAPFADYTLLCHNRGTGENVFTYNYCNLHDTPCQLTSTRNIQPKLNFTFSPNPSREQITLEFPASIRDFQVKVYNLRGREVLSVQEKLLDISYLARGIYVIALFSDGQWLGSRKMVKE